MVGWYVGSVAGGWWWGFGGVCREREHAPGGAFQDIPSCCLRHILSKQVQISRLGIFTFANLALSPRRLVLRRPHLVAVAAAGARVLFARDLRRTCCCYVEASCSLRNILLWRVGLRRKYWSRKSVFMRGSSGVSAARARIMSIVLSAVTKAKRNIYTQRLFRYLLLPTQAKGSIRSSIKELQSDEIGKGRFNIHLCNFSTLGSIDMRLLTEGKADLGGCG